MLTAPASLPFKAKFSSRSTPPPKQTSNREREYLYPHEVETLIQSARKVGRHGLRDAAMILLMFRHGLRTTELVTLKWSQVDLKSGYIDIVRVKNGNPSRHPLRGSELRSLRQIEHERCLCVLQRRTEFWCCQECKGFRFGRTPWRILAQKAITIEMVRIIWRLGVLWVSPIDSKRFLTPSYLQILP